MKQAGLTHLQVQQEGLELGEYLGVAVSQRAGRTDLHETASRTGVPVVGDSEVRE